jgi:hypothetical protein
LGGIRLFVNIFPNFDKGRILKQEMLENLRDYPRNFFDIYFKYFSKGIISGADLVVGEKDITVAKGIIKFENKIYMLEREVTVPYYATNKEVIIKVKFIDQAVKGDFNINTAELFIDENTFIERDELELGRFKLREGAQLRADYKDFLDFSTEYNTLNIINVEYSGVKKSTLHPSILRYFSAIILKSEVDNAYDITFAMQCMNQMYMDRELILYYISNRLGIEYKEYSNMQIYKHLSQIAREAESGVKRKIETRHNRQTRIIVD